MAGKIKPRGEMTPDELKKARARDCEKRRLRGYGTPLNVTPGELAAATAIIAAAHQRGMSYPAMERQLGVGRQLLADVHRGRKGTIRRVNYEAIIALEFIPTPDDGIRHGARLNATGSVRRIDALRAKGYPKDYLAAYIGVQHQNLPPGVGGSKWIYPAMATKVREMYEKLRETDPRDLCTETGVRRAEMRAARLGLISPDCWDDDTIDDPDAFPEHTGHCGTQEGWLSHRLYDIPICEACRGAVNFYGKNRHRDQLGEIKARYVFYSDNIFEVMARRQLTGNAIEVELGLTKGVTSRWFNPESYNPSWKSGLKLASFLDLSWTDIYKRKEMAS